MNKVFGLTFFAIAVIAVGTHKEMIGIIATLQGIFWLIVHYGDKLLKD